MKYRVARAYGMFSVGRIIEPPAGSVSELKRRGWIEDIEQPAPPVPANDSAKTPEPARARRGRPPKALTK